MIGDKSIVVAISVPLLTLAAIYPLIRFGYKLGVGLFSRIIAKIKPRPLGWLIIAGLVTLASITPVSGIREIAAAAGEGNTVAYLTLTLALWVYLYFFSMMSAVTFLLLRDVWRNARQRDTL